MAQAAQEADADADKHLVKNQTAEVAAIKSEEPKTDTANTTDTQKKSTENEVLTRAYQRSRFCTMTIFMFYIMSHCYQLQGS